MLLSLVRQTSICPLNGCARLFPTVGAGRFALPHQGAFWPILKLCSLRLIAAVLLAAIRAPTGASAISDPTNLRAAPIRVEAACFSSAFVGTRTAKALRLIDTGRARMNN
jgi:hypothetical protein